MLTPNGYPGSICENAYQLLVSGQLKVMASCTNWLREFRNYHRDDKGSGKIVKRNEQSRGEEPDVRSDIYSFGLVLYEMATGRPRQPGVLGRLPNKRLERLIAKALENDPEERFQSTAEMRLALLRAKNESASQSRRKRIAFAATASLVLIASGLAWRMRQVDSATAGPAQQLVPLTTSSAEVALPAFSQDGNVIAYSAKQPGEDHMGIYVQWIGGAALLRITTEPVDHFSPAFSPDGRYIAHFHKWKVDGDSDLRGC